MFTTSTIHSLFIFASLFISFSFSILVSAQVTEPTTTTPALPRRFIRADDSDSAITYSSQWRQLTRGKSSDGLQCPASECFSAGLDPSRVHEGTWHEATGAATVSYTFSGVGVVVHGVLPNQQGSVTSLTFLLDGIVAGTMFRRRSGAGGGGGDEWFYDSTVFTITGLSNGRHNLTIRQATESIFVLDYLDIEKPTQDPPRSTTTVQTLVQPTPSQPPLSSTPGSAGPIITRLSAIVATSVSSASQRSAPSAGSFEDAKAVGRSKGIAPVGVAMIVIALIIVLGTILAAVIYLRRAKASRLFGSPGSLEPPAHQESNRTLIEEEALKIRSPLSSMFSLTPRSKKDFRGSVCSVQTLNEPDGTIKSKASNKYGAPSLNVVQANKNLANIPASLPPSRTRPSRSKRLALPFKASHTETGPVKSSLEQEGPSFQSRIHPPLVVVNGPRASLSTIGSAGKPLPPPPRSRRMFNPVSPNSPSLSIQVPSPCLSIDYSQLSQDKMFLASPPVPKKLSMLSVPQSAETRSSISSQPTSGRQTRNVSYFQDSSLSRWKDHAIVVQGRREFFDCAFARDAHVAPSVSQDYAPTQRKSDASKQTFGHSDYPPGGGHH